MRKQYFLIPLLVFCLSLLCFLFWDVSLLPDGGKPASVSDVPSGAQKLRTVSGVVTGATMNTLTLRTDKGDTYTFMTADAERRGPPGTLTGDTFTVTYGGVSAGMSHVAFTYEKTAAKKREPHGGLPASIPEAWLDGGVFEACYPKAYEKLRTLTLEEKVGQLFLARYPGKQALSAVHVFQPGGFILFGEDFEGKSREEVRAMLSAVQETSPIPLLFATDEEGGTVVRVSSNPRLADAPFPAPQTLYALGGVEALQSDARSKAALLGALGIHVNLGPVSDVSTDPDDYIYRRTIGQPADKTAECVAGIVTAAQKAGLSCTLKHFPGYGGNADTHTGVAYDNRPMSQFEQSDFLPFEAGIEAGAHSVLVSHNIVACMDETRPASLSPAVHKLLRDKLQFTGVIMTDDLAMDAIRDFTGESHPAVRALLSGNDLILVTDLEGGVRSVTEALKSGTISEEALNRAVFRILSWKYTMGIFL